MGEDRQFKHVCKFCNKSFPCGRSLGGHMRSHMINNSSGETTDDKLAKKKFSSVNNIDTNTNTEVAGYGLRENPKKSRRLADSSEDTSLQDKFSKESGKGPLSWKALVGNIKCQSDKERVSNNASLEDQDSWTSANQKLVMDSQSDNETAAPNRRRRSKRRTRYMATANSCSFSVANNNNGSSCVSEIEQEQEEVAMCLMMLSRDVAGSKGGLNSVAESSDNNSIYLEAKIEVKNSVCSRDEILKLKKLKQKQLESGFVDSENCQVEGRQSEYSASGIPRKGSKVNKSEVSIVKFVKNDRIKKSQLPYQLGDEISEVELEKNSMTETELDQSQLGSNKYNSTQKKLRDSFEPELGSDSMKKSTSDASHTEFHKDSQKRSKFECATCNKIFHSYQALGGHRASHKKIKGCFASKIDSCEISIETELSPDPTADSKLIKSNNNESSIDHLVAVCDYNKAGTSYEPIKKRHECPICLKVFSSGQALGGHKRSHLVGSTEAKNNPTILIEKPVPEIRNFLDLNLPAPVEEESNNDHLGYKSWWIASSHKHEALVGLISN